MSNTARYTVLTPPPRVSAHVPDCQRTASMAHPRAVTVSIRPLGASSPEELRWEDIRKAERLDAGPEVSFPWPLRLACGALAVVLLPAYLVSRLTKPERWR